MIVGLHLETMVACHALNCSELVDRAYYSKILSTASLFSIKLSVYLTGGPKCPWKIQGQDTIYYQRMYVVMYHTIKYSYWAKRFVIVFKDRFYIDLEVNE